MPLAPSLVLLRSAPCILDIDSFASITLEGVVSDVEALVLESGARDDGGGDMSREMELRKAALCCRPIDASVDRPSASLLLLFGLSMLQVLKLRRLLAGVTPHEAEREWRHCQDPRAATETWCSRPLKMQPE